MQPRALPGRVVGVLDGQRRQRIARSPGRERRVERASSRISTPIDQPSETMWCMRQQQARAPRQPAGSAGRGSAVRAQVERRTRPPPRHSCSERARRSAASRRGPRSRSAKPRSAGSELHDGSPSTRANDAAQRLVPRHEPVQRAAQRRHVERAAQPQRQPACDRRRSPARAGPGTTAAAGRTTAAAARARDAWRSAAAPAPLGAERSRDRLRPAGQRGRGEQRRQRQLDARALRGCAATSCTASSECPPSSKKLSWRPTRSTPQQLLPDRRERLFDLALRRLVARARSACASGAGSALRSTLPFGVSGSAPAARTPPAPCTPAARVARCARSAVAAAARASSPRHQYATRRLSPGTSSRATTTASRTAGVLRAAAPRSRPARSGSRGSSPGGRCGPGTRWSRPPATGPGRRSGTAARPASALNGSGTNRSAVSSGRSRYPRATPHAADVQLARHPDRHRLARARPARRSACSRSAARSAPARSRPAARTRHARHVHRRLGRAVQVVQPRLRQPRQEPLHQRRRQRLAAAQHPPQRSRTAPRPARSRNTCSIDGTKCSVVIPLAADQSRRRYAGSRCPPGPRQHQPRARSSAARTAPTPRRRS